MSSTSNPTKNTYYKRRFRRRPYRGRAKATFRIAQRAARTEITRKERRERELKVYDTEIAQVPIPLTGAIFPITQPIAQGDLRNQRNAAQIYVQNLFFRYQLTVADTSNIVRVVVFRWMDATVPLATSIFEVLPTSGTIHPLSALHYNNRKFINVLFDQMMTVDSDDPIKIEKAFLAKKYSCWWNTNSTVGQKGQVYIVAVSDSAAVSHPVLHSLIRVKYYDS